MQGQIMKYLLNVLEKNVTIRFIIVLGFDLKGKQNGQAFSIRLLKRMLPENRYLIYGEIMEFMEHSAWANSRFNF